MSANPLSRHSPRRPMQASALFLLWLALLLVTASSITFFPVSVPPSPAVPTFDASVIPSGLPFPSGCANPKWNASNPKTCLMPKINGVIYHGPRNPSWDPTGASSKWVIKTTRSQTPIVGILVAKIPGTDSFFFIGRSSKISFNADGDTIAGVYDRVQNTFRNVSSQTNSFCGGLTMTSEGQVLVAGGTSAEEVGGVPDGRTAVRVYDFMAKADRISDTVQMRHRRWYPTVTLLADGNAFIIGGTQTASETGTPSAFFEKWLVNDPTTYPIPRYPVDPTFMPQMGKQFYPAVFVLPTGDIFILQDQSSRIITPDGRFRQIPGSTRSLSGPDCECICTACMDPSRWKTQFPHIGTAAMTALTWENNYESVDVVMFGGSPNEASTDVRTWCPATNNTAKTRPANRYSYRLSISWQYRGGDWEYSFGNWVEEDMGIPRVGGDATLLPNGDVVLTGGAQTGCSCGIKNGTNRGNYPALWPLLYQPDRREGQRYTVMQASSIARMYHGSAALTNEGTVLVQGCDACERKSLVSTASWWLGSPDQRWEFRIEEFYPPYVLDYEHKPEIVSVNDISNSAPPPVINMGTPFTVKWKAFTQSNGIPAWVWSITNVALVAPSSVTHGCNSNQRVVFLRILRQTWNTITVQMPPLRLPGTLPPQYYKLFLLNGKTYSSARWIKVVNRQTGPRHLSAAQYHQQELHV